jgi:hypothetical protein
MSARQLVDEPLPLRKVRKRRHISADAKPPPQAKIVLTYFWLLDRTRPTLTRREAGQPSQS